MRHRTIQRLALLGEPISRARCATEELLRRVARLGFSNDAMHARGIETRIRNDASLVGTYPFHACRAGGLMAVTPRPKNATPEDAILRPLAR